VGGERKCGPDLLPILMYFPRKDPAVGFDWCAAFVYHCCREAGFDLPVRYPAPVRCNFAGVRAWLEWAQRPETGYYYTRTAPGFHPQRGDLIIFNNVIDGGPHDHIGVVTGRRGSILITAEGNVGNRSGIFRRPHTRHVRGFIRIPASYQYRG
jgi:hypothetical protein